MSTGQQSHLEHGRKERASMTEKNREKAREKGRFYYQKNKEKLLARQKRICKIAKKYRCTCK